MTPRSNAEIFIVDDDALARATLAKIIGAGAYQCREAGSGAEAWESIHENPPALLLLDYDMPEMDGDELLKRLRADSNPAIAQLPTIMLTGHTGEESEVRCLEAGADDFVTKPIKIPILRARIETQLRLSDMRRQLELQNEELEAWRANLERDLESARLTQHSLIPQKPLQLDGWDIATYFRPVIQVGGDIYGWLPMKDGRVLFWIADATGHGASAALLTTLTKLLFHHGSAEETTPAAIMNAVNRDFRSIFGTRLFMTAMCVALEPRTGRATVVGAGHPPLLVAHRGKAEELIWSSAPPVGLADRTQFEETIVDLERGDALLLYTDGLFGSTDENRLRLNPQRLAATFNPNAPTAEAMLLETLHAAGPFNGEGNYSDDIAAVTVRRTR
jgi:sigma-B regulation protein RsbU (phosphoserine phosphatase)